MDVKTGIEVLRDEGYRRLKGKRVGLMTHLSAVDRQLRGTLQLMWADGAVDLAALFAPEHGLSAAAPDAAGVATGKDPRTGLPIHSLYGETYRPTADMLEGLDAIVCDVQDVGVRYYTYPSTISYIMEAAGEHGVSVVILDRPNPLGGEVVWGPTLEPHLSSFVGRFPVPVQHGLTLGELSLLINATWNPHPAEVSVVPCEGWRRSMRWDDTGFAWAPASPALSHISAVYQYPGSCLIEGTTLSEGRGTPLPFEVVGAPWLDGTQLAERLNEQGWPGVRFRAHSFLPTASKWNGQYCHGVQAHAMDLRELRPLETWLGVIGTIRSLYPDQFAWLSPDQEGVEPSAQHFDRLIGSERTRKQIDEGASLDEITEGWDEFCRAFRQQRQPFLLYP